MAKPTGFVIYHGPSVLDGMPIVAIAITGSTNRKTGDMVQTYILRADEAPLDALKSGADASICGDCKHRPILGGACYVNVAHGPRSVWAAWQGGAYPVVGGLAVSWRTLRLQTAGRMIRLGAYGDPMAVPYAVWHALLEDSAGHTGYTHQWANASIPQAQRDAITALCMASADSPAEMQAARAQGKRTFRVRLADEPVLEREFTCPASEEAGKRKTCLECGACNGSAKATAASVVIIAHGAKARRFIAIRAQ